MSNNISYVICIVENDNINTLELKKQKKYASVLECKELFFDVVTCIFSSFYEDFAPSNITDVGNRSIHELSIEWIKEDVACIKKTPKDNQQNNYSNPSGKYQLLEVWKYAINHNLCLDLCGYLFKCTE